MIKIAVCDDEVSAVQNLSDKINLFMESRGFEYTLSKFFSGESLLSDVSGQNVYYDAVFLDIKMDKLGGMDTAKEIRNASSKTA